MIDQLVHALVHSRNEAADDVLLESLRLGNDTEKSLALSALIKRQTVRGLSGVVGMYSTLAEPLQATVLANIKQFHSALRECGRSDDTELRLAAMRLIAVGRQGRLTYVLSESLHGNSEVLVKGAVEAIGALARWVSTTTRGLQKGPAAEGLSIAPGDGLDPELVQLYEQLMEHRADIEQAVARAVDVHRGAHGQDLLRAALLLCDWPGSRTLAILHTAKHGGQSPMVRRLQQTPEAEHVEAFLLGASHGGLRSQFGVSFSHIDQTPVLDAILHRTHWLKDHQLQVCVHQVSRGTWWGEADLTRDLQHRTAADAPLIANWLAASGVHDMVQDERIETIRQHVKGDLSARLRLLRIAMARGRGGSVKLLKAFLSDPDERLVRLAAREIVRRRPADSENILLQLMTTAPPTVRRVISRAVGQSGFEQFWARFDRLDKVTRRAAGLAMLKILPDGVARLGRRLTSGPPQQRIKALQIAQELDIANTFAPALAQLCSDPNPKVRSKAVAALGELSEIPSGVLLDRVLADSDARVRANAIEVLESKRKAEYVPMLAQRARSAHNRERANAIKALHRMKVGTAVTQLGVMLQDDRPEHRISAMWTLRQIGWWKLLHEIGDLAKHDPNMRVRRYALAILRELARTLEPAQAQVA